MKIMYDTNIFLDVLLERERDCIVTRNKKDFENFDISVLDPSEILQQL